MIVTIKPKMDTTQTRFLKISALALMKCRFQFYLSERLETLSESRYWWYDIIKWIWWSHVTQFAFYGPLCIYLLFSAFYRLFCRIADLWDIALKFSWHIYDVIIWQSCEISWSSRKWHLLFFTAYWHLGVFVENEPP